MAVIAKFVSYDGGIAFSEKAMKIQRQDEDALVVPLDDVVSVRVRRPQEDSEGFVRVETADGKRIRIFFDDEQLQEAVQFKKAFDATVSDFDDDHALAPVPERNAYTRPQRQNRYAESTRAYREYSERAPKKPIFRKWWFWAACAVLVVGVIGAIAGGGEDEKENTPSAASQNVSEPATQNDVQSASEQVSGAVNIGDYDVEIKSAFKTVDYEGNPALVITYTWTNNSDDTTSALASLMEKAFQDGVQLEFAILGEVDGYDPNPYMTEIRPGTSLDVQHAFVLRSDSVVEVEVSDLFGFSDPATKTFDPNNL